MIAKRTSASKGTRYVVQVYDPRCKNRKRWVGTFDSLSEARKAEKQALDDRDPIMHCKLVRDWAELWLKEFPRPAVSTQKLYAWAIGRIIADVGHIKLELFGRKQASRWAHTWSDSVTRVARTLFWDAARYGLIQDYPFGHIRRNESIGRKDLDAPTEQDIQNLAECAVPVWGEPYGWELRAMILFLGYVGVRPGELFCLRREDLDEANGEVIVRYALGADNREKAPKNGKVRVVSVPEPALAGLRAVPSALRLRRLATTTAITDGLASSGRYQSKQPPRSLPHISPYLFHGLNGQRLGKTSFAYYWNPIAQRWSAQNKDRHITPYHLRHACATMLVERDLPSNVVANQLGHSDGGILVQTLYGHPDEKRMRQRVRDQWKDWKPDQPSDITAADVVPIRRSA